MTRFENEGYRPREGIVATLSQDDCITLSEDHPATGDDLYHAKPLDTTASADEKVTIGETEANKVGPRKSSRKRITKAIKMLTSAVATVTIAATLSAGGTLGDWAEDVLDGFRDHYDYIYSWFGPNDGQGFSFSEHSQNSYFVQAFGGDQGFRIQSLDEDVRLMCHEAYDFNDGGIYIVASDTEQERFGAVLEISPGKLSTEDPYELIGTVEVAETGEVFNYRAIQLMYDHEYVRTPEEFAAALEILLTKLSFESVDYDSWNRVQLGRSLFSNTNTAWYGIGTGGGNGYGRWTFHHMGDSASVDVGAFTKLTSRTINGIKWSFYEQNEEENYNDILWCAPNTDDILLGAGLMDLREIVGEDRENIVDYVCETGLINIYPLSDKDKVGSGSWTPQIPVDPPADDPVVGPVVSGPDLTLYDRDYPQFVPSMLSGGLSCSHVSNNSGWVQFGLNGVDYRMEGTTDQIHMMILKLLGNATGSYHDVYEGSWKMIISDEETGLNVSAYFALDPRNLYTDGEMELTGELWTDYPGQTLYYSLQGASVTSSGAYNTDEATFRKQATELLNKLRFTQPDPNNWNRVQLGNTMYSEMTTEWAGISSGDTNYIAFDSISKASLHDLSAYKYIWSRGINGITWHFFADTTYSSLHDMKIWCIPGHEDIAFGMRCSALLTQEFDVDAALMPAQVPQNNLEQLTDRLEEAALCYIHSFPGTDLTSTLQIPSQPEVSPTDPVVTPVLTVSSEYPRWGGLELGYGWQTDPVSYNSRWVQFGFNGSVHRLTTDSDNLHMMLISLVGDHAGLEDPYFQNYINVMIRDINTGYGVEIGFAPTEDTLNSGDENSITGTILTYSGQELLFRTHHLFGYEDLYQAKAWLQNVVRQIYFAEPDPAEWGRVQLGNLMYCQTTENWSVFSCGQNAHFRVNGAVDRFEDLDLSQYQLLDTRVVNQVPWTFYYDDTMYDFYALKIWAVPAHRDFVLGFDATLMYYGLKMPYSDVGDIEDTYKLQAVDYIVDNAISTYYLLPGVDMGEYEITVTPAVTIEQEYPSFQAHTTQLMKTAHNPYSRNSSFVQFNMNGTLYRMETTDRNHHLMVTNVIGPHTGAYALGNELSFRLLMADSMTGFSCYVDFYLDESARQSTDSLELMGEMENPNSGEIFYYHAFPISGSEDMSQDAFQLSAAVLLHKLQFTAPNRYFWNQVGIGTTMYSEINDYWNGVSTGQDNYFAFDFVTTLEQFRSAEYLQPSYIATRTVNNITWHFYYVEGTYEDLMLWCIPAHEEIALGMLCGRVMTEAGIDMGEILVDYLQFTQEDFETLMSYVIDKAIGYYHPLPEAVTSGDTVSVVPPVMETYAQILPSETQTLGYRVQPVSANSNSVQFSVGRQTHRLESAADGVFLAVSSDYGAVSESNLYGSDAVILDITDLKAGYSNRFLLTPEDIDLSVSLCHGSLVDETTGVTFYYSLRGYTGGMNDNQNAAAAEALLAQIRFVEADESDWSRLQIGEGVYLQTEANWQGFGDLGFSDFASDGDAQFEFLAEAAELDTATRRHISAATVNGIDWNLYYDPADMTDPYACRLIMVLENEGLALGFPCMNRLISLGYTFSYDQDFMNVPDDQLQILGEYVIGNLLPMFHLIEN